VEVIAVEKSQDIKVRIKKAGDKNGKEQKKDELMTRPFLCFW